MQVVSTPPHIARLLSPLGGLQVLVDVVYLISRDNSAGLQAFPVPEALSQAGQNTLKVALLPHSPSLRLCSSISYNPFC